MMQESDEFISSADIGNCRKYRQHKSNLKKRNQSSSHCLRNCLRFCLKKQTNVEQRGATMDPQHEPITTATAEGRLRELTCAWFIQTQAPLISHNGLFPNWFFGFISRRDAEDILNDKQCGYFLVRLSDRALGYILSYRGRDRCRHFVINQSDSGQFIVYGDSVGHDTVAELIEYFKEKPIEPYGEYLTTSCFGAQNEDLYDTIQASPKQRPVATVHAQTKKQQSSQRLDQVLSRNRRKNETEEIPALPRRSRNVETDSTSENPDMVCYAQVKTKKSRGRQVNRAAPDNSSRPSSVYSEELLDSRSRSMPLLLSSSEEQSYRLSVTPPLPSRDTPSPEPSHRGPCSSPSPEPSHRGPCSTPNPEPTTGRPLSTLSLDLYHVVSQPNSDTVTTAEDGGVYAEIPREHCPLVDNTYEQLPMDCNRYESVGFPRAKHEPSPRGVRNDKWKRFFPDVRRKW